MSPLIPTELGDLSQPQLLAGITALSKICNRRAGKLHQPEKDVICLILLMTIEQSHKKALQGDSGAI